MKVIRVYSDEVMETMWSAIQTRYEAVKDCLYTTIDCYNNPKEDLKQLVTELNDLRKAMDYLHHAKTE